jgi:hypothetical protein
LPETYGQVSKRKSSKNIDIASQHSHVYPKPRPAQFTGWWLSGELPR